MAKIFWIAEKSGDYMKISAFNNKRKAEEKAMELSSNFSFGDTEIPKDGNEDGDNWFYSGMINAKECFLLYRKNGMPAAIGFDSEDEAREEYPGDGAGACFPVKLKGGMGEVYLSSEADANGTELWIFEDGDIYESKKEEYDMKSIQTFEAFTHNVVNEKIALGSYYFSRYAFDGFDLPAKGETSYALVIHNTVEVNGESMYLRSKNDHNVGAGFRPKVVAVAEDQDSIEAAYKTHVKIGGEGANLSISYGSFNIKGQNCAYTEIDGITKKLK